MTKTATTDRIKAGQRVRRISNPIEIATCTYTNHDYDYAELRYDAHDGTPVGFAFRTMASMWEAVPLSGSIPVVLHAEEFPHGDGPAWWEVVVLDPDTTADDACYPCGISVSWYPATGEVKG